MIVSLMRRKPKYDDNLLQEYDLQKQHFSLLEIMYNSLSDIIIADRYIYNRHKSWGDDSAELITQKIADAKYNIYKNSQIFELAINDYFNTTKLTCKCEKGVFRVYEGFMSNISKIDSKYLILKEKLQQCKIKNHCGAKLTYHPNFIDLSIL